MDCLQTRQLVYRYGQDTVLDGIDLRVPEGSIYGFLGPNGAGKTTTLRLILGLLARQQGEITLFGERLERNRIGILRRIGSMIESPSFYEHLTARENLRLLQTIHRCPPQRIDEVLALAGLADTGRKRTSQFSLGMKQRLGIAIALLHDPALLILDEPTNGLDPNGIVEIRELLKRINRERGITLLVSSHLLGEIEKLVTHVGVLHRGRLQFQGTIEALKQQQQTMRAVMLRTGDRDATLRVLAAAGVTADAQDDGIAIPPLPRERVAAINRALVAAGVEVYEIGLERNDLESIFMDLVEAA